jgi:hypothetical protein
LRKWKTAKDKQLAKGEKRGDEKDVAQEEEEEGRVGRKLR